jgi:hypothetical protein
MKGLVFPPTIDLKVGVQCKNIGGLKFFGEPNQAGIGQIDFAVTIFSQILLQDTGLSRKAKRQLENARCNILDCRLRSAAQTAQQVAVLGNYSLTGKPGVVRALLRIRRSLCDVFHFGPAMRR